MKEQDYLTGREFFNSESLGITDKNLIQRFVSNLNFPFLVSFPRTGSHWLRMLMELYFHKPSLTRVFYYHQSQDFLTFHSHDINLELERKNVIYLWRNPVPAIYSQMTYCKEDVRDRERIKYWSKVYAKHLSKWLISENFSDKKTIVKYENLRDSLKDEFAKITAHFDEALNLDKLENIAQIVSKQEVQKKTKHDVQVIATDPLYETTREYFQLKHGQEIIDLVIEENKDLIEHGILDEDSKTGNKTESELLKNSESLEKESVNFRSNDRCKIVGLIAARNEQLLIKQCLLSLARYTDAIVYLDDASDDDTLKVVESLAQECQIEKIIRKQKWHRDEPGDRNAMLRAGREIGGTHFIALDADELFTSNCLDNNFLREQIVKLQPGDKILLNWIQLWRSLHQYRFDGSVWTWNYKGFIFCDDGQCSYSSAFIHTPRIPQNLSGSSKRIEGYDYGVMHFQFVNWRNLLVKQSWYRCLERIRHPQKPLAKINQRYAPSKDEANLGVSDSPYKWFSGYEFFDPSIYNFPEKWREKQVLQWFAEHGREYFAELDIWDVDWGKCGDNFPSIPAKYKVSAIVSTYNSEEFIMRKAINHFCIANLWKREKKVDLAITNYQQAITINPKSPWFHNGLGDSFAQQENWGKSVICYRQALTINPNSAWFNFCLAKALTKQGNIDEAVTYYQKAITLKPNQKIIQKKLQDIDKEYHALAEKCFQENHLEKAIANYQKAIKFNPDYAWYHFGLGKALHYKGKIEDAIACYRKAINLNPNIPDFRHLLGEALTKQEQLEEAISSYKAALELAPTAAHCYRGLGFALYKKGELEPGIDFLKRAIELSPKYLAAYNQLGEALFAHGDFSQAIACYEKSIELNPKSPFPYGQIAEILAEQGQIEQAVQYYRNAIKLDSRHQATHPNLVAALSPSE